VERRDNCAYANRLTYHHFINASSDILQEITLHQSRNATGDLNIFDSPTHLSASLVQGLAVLENNRPGQFLEVIFKQILKFEEILNPVGWGHLPPTLECPSGRVYRCVHSICSRCNDGSESLTGGWVTYFYLLSTVYLLPLPADEIR